MVLSAPDGANAPDDALAPFRGYNDTPLRDGCKHGLRPFLTCVEEGLYLDSGIDRRIDGGYDSGLACLPSSPRARGSGRDSLMANRDSFTKKIGRQS